MGYWKWIDYQILELPDGSDLVEVIGIIRDCFNVDKIWGKIGYLSAELTLMAGGIELIDLPGAKLFEPNIKQRDWFFREYQKAENELYEIAQAIEKIEAGEIRTIEIQIKLNKGKRSARTINIKHGVTLPLIIQLLKGLPPGQPMEKTSKGSPEKKAYKQFMQDAVKKCFELIEPTAPELSETDKLFFAGLVLTLAGIFPQPKKYNEGETIESYQMQIYKDKLSDQLKYYKP